MGPALKRLLRLIPSYRLLEEKKSQLTHERDTLRARLQVLEAEQAAVKPWLKFFPPGHFYSPLPSPEEIAEVFARGEFGPPFPAVNLNEAEQLARLERFAGFYAEQPFPVQPTAGRRFHLENISYGPYDAIMLYGMLREARPRRIIEVGSGYSTLLARVSLALGSRPHLARFAVHNLQRKPGTFEKLVAINSGELGLRALRPGDALALATGL